MLCYARLFFHLKMETEKCVRGFRFALRCDLQSFNSMLEHVIALCTAWNVEMKKRYSAISVRRRHLTSSYPCWPSSPTRYRRKSLATQANAFRRNQLCQWLIWLLKYDSIYWEWSAPVNATLKRHDTWMIDGDGARVAIWTYIRTVYYSDRSIRRYVPHVIIVIINRFAGKSISAQITLWIVYYLRCLSAIRIQFCLLHHWLARVYVGM